MKTMRTVALIFVLALAAPNVAVSQDSAPYTTIFYNSGSLRIEGYLYKPTGNGPFPVIIYNHGSRKSQERSERPFQYIGSLLTKAGYAVLVPERRGYGKSDGQMFSEEVGSDVGAPFIRRLQAESEDVLAALGYLATVPWVDTARVAIMGWSFGGIVSVFAASHNSRFFAVINQTGGALSWRRSLSLQSALPRAALQIRSPVYCMAAENDATTASVKSVYEAARSKGTEALLTIYPPFTPKQSVNRIAPGHLIFGPQGMTIWAKDVVAFLDQHRPH
jgi:dienelactone hydrolase